MRSSGYGYTVEQELQGNAVMARLIQGDVGSGKTIVAILALVMAAAISSAGSAYGTDGGAGAAAFCFFYRVDGKKRIPVSCRAAHRFDDGKAEAGSLCQNRFRWQVSVVIGTHALIQEKVQYQNLALVITDEQHRFGVRQRETLSKKGAYPHTIVMSATPIPRTLAVILYGDLDISVINEMPANRLPIKNCVVNTGYRKKAYEFIRRQVEAGHQAYVICPMVEESEAIDAENVVEYTEVLRTELPPAFTIEYLHGKMKPKEKNEIMERFLERGDSGACLHDGHRGWGQCAECDCNDDRKFGTVWTGTAASAARTGRTWQCTGVLHFSAHLGR